MTLEDIKTEMRSHGFDATVKGGTLTVRYKGHDLESFVIHQTWRDGESLHLEASTDEVQYGVDRRDGKIEMQQLLEVLEDRKELVEDDLKNQDQ